MSGCPLTQLVWNHSCHRECYPLCRAHLKLFQLPTELRTGMDQSGYIGLHQPLLKSVSLSVGRESESDHRIFPNVVPVGNADCFHPLVGFKFDQV